MQDPLIGLGSLTSWLAGFFILSGLTYICDLGQDDWTDAVLLLQGSSPYVSSGHRQRKRKSEKARVLLQASAYAKVATIPGDSASYMVKPKVLEDNTDNGHRVWIYRLKNVNLIPHTTGKH